jgi:hypothetical protein
MESSLIIDLKNIPEGFSVVGHYLLVYELSSSVVYILGYGCQEGESVNLDSIDAENNFVLLCEEFL